MQAGLEVLETQEQQVIQELMVLVLMQAGLEVLETQEQQVIQELMVM
jgi:hypothetical protein